MQKKPSPYSCHIFVCTNCRTDDDKSCYDGESPEIKKGLKKEVNSRGLKGRVRVSNSGCMGLCQEGPNVMIHPQNDWFSRVGTGDVAQILAHVESLINQSDEA